MAVHTTHELVVDSTRGETINIDVSFLRRTQPARTPCPEGDSGCTCSSHALMSNKPFSALWQCDCQGLRAACFWGLAVAMCAHQHGTPTAATQQHTKYRHTPPTSQKQPILTGIQPRYSFVPPQKVDITFPRLPCSWLSLDAMDVSGELHLDVVRLLGSRQWDQPTQLLVFWAAAFLIS